ncbi:MAG TPA: hypothetical protein VHT91_45405 [Kofleriaceae bacterium]|jgi:hypothetical protein|nr:hypothetical protein [Kofleriaceae bacterium]
MTVTVRDHLHDTLVLESGGPLLILQTGTLVFDFPGSDEGDWKRDSLSHPVFELRGGWISADVRAIASAAPASMSYSPLPAAIAIDRERPLLAEGDVVLAGTGDGFGADSGLVQVRVTVGGHIALPVTGSDRASAGVQIPQAGWAVDRTRAVRAGTHIQLVADLAAIGPSRLMRLAYSMFVVISPKTHLTDPVDRRTARQP